MFLPDLPDDSHYWGPNESNSGSLNIRKEAILLLCTESEMQFAARSRLSLAPTPGFTKKIFCTAVPFSIMHQPPIKSKFHQKPF